MLEIEIKLSHEMLRLIADIERFTGFWPRVAQNELLTSEANEMAALLEAIACLSELEESMPPHARYLAREQRSTGASVASRSELENRLRGQPLLANFAAAYLSSCTLTRQDFLYLQNLIINGGQQPTQFRLLTSKFRSPDGEMIFPTTAAFLIDSRLDEIFYWIDHCLTGEQLHPLLVYGVAQLLLLQLSPFEQYSHSVSQIFVWKLLIDGGYDFLRFAHPVVQFQREKENYFIALRQAEKTAGSSWNTLAVWLEFYLISVRACCRQLESRLDRVDRASRLTAVQRDILEVVRANGSASRELIVSSTGINPSTVKYNLSLLAAHGLLRRSGGGRSTTYRMS